MTLKYSLENVFFIKDNQGVYMDKILILNTGKKTAQVANHISHRLSNRLTELRKMNQHPGSCHIEIKSIEEFINTSDFADNSIWQQEYTSVFCLLEDETSIPMIVTVVNNISKFCKIENIRHFIGFMRFHSTDINNLVIKKAGKLYQTIQDIKPLALMPIILDDTSNENEFWNYYRYKATQLIINFFDAEKIIPFMQFAYYIDLLKNMLKDGGLVYIEQIHGKDSEELMAQVKDKFQNFPKLEQIKSGAIITLLRDNNLEFPSLDDYDSYIGEVEIFLSGKSWVQNQEIYCIHSNREYSKDYVVLEIMPHWYID